MLGHLDKRKKNSIVYTINLMFGSLHNWNYIHFFVSCVV